MNPPRQHLSVYTDQTGTRVWSVLHKGMPLCAPTTKESASKVWERWFPGVAPAVWDGDAGAWQADLTGDGE